MQEKLFEKELQEWMKTTLSPYCLNECKSSCCDGDGTIQIDKGYEHLFKTFKLTGKPIPLKNNANGESHLFRNKQNGNWYFSGKTCPNFDPKSKKCLVHNKYPRCELYPLIKTGRPNKGYTLFSVCSLHKLQENQEPLRSLVMLCKKYGFKFYKEKIWKTQ
jgi:hypothetical protein